jgi:hypothetical protein
LASGIDDERSLDIIEFIKLTVLIEITIGIEGEGGTGIGEWYLYGLKVTELRVITA